MHKKDKLNDKMSRKVLSAYKSSSLGHLLIILATLGSLITISIRVDSPALVKLILITCFLISFVTYLICFVHSYFNNSDALRSEGYLLVKKMIELKRLIIEKEADLRKSRP